MAKRVGLSPEGIVAAAAAVADAGGLSQVSMRNVARELGVEAMSLYHHIPGKESLLDSLADWAFALIDAPEPGEPWRSAMVRRAVSTRRVLGAHPWALGLLESRPAPGPALLRHHDRVLGCLLEAGFPVPHAVSAVSTIDAYVYGFVFTEESLPFASDQETTAFAEGIDLDPERFPHLARMLTELLPAEYSFADEFTRGLDLVLGAIAARVQRHALRG